MRFPVTFGDFNEVTDAIYDDIADEVTDIASRVSRGTVLDLRRAAVAAGLGQRFANTWRNKVYPEGRTSANAAAFIWSKAAAIAEAFDQGTIIRPTGSRRFLAIPTPNVPRTSTGKGATRYMTPREVEQAFGQPLEYARSPKGALFAFIEAMPAASGKGYRRVSKGRLSQGRKAEAVVMFFLVPLARMPRLTDIESIAAFWAEEFMRGLKQVFG